MDIVRKQSEQNFFHEATDKIDNLSENKLMKILSHLETASEEIHEIKKDRKTTCYADIGSSVEGISSSISQLHGQISLLISQKQIRESQMNLSKALHSANMSDLERATLQTILTKHGFLK